MEKPKRKGKGKGKGKGRNPRRKFHSDRVMGIRSGNKNNKNFKRRANVSKTKRQSFPFEF